MTSNNWVTIILATFLGLVSLILAAGVSGFDLLKITGRHKDASIGIEAGKHPEKSEQAR